MTKRVAVIGAGLGGMASAAMISAAGHDVTLFEKQTWLGGKCRRVYHNGVIIDTGPAMFTFPKLWKKFLERWESFANKPAPELELVRLQTIGRYLHEDYNQNLPFNRNDDGFEEWQAYVRKYKSLAEPLLNLLSVDPKGHQAIWPALKMMSKLGGRFDMSSWLRHENFKCRKLHNIVALQAMNAGGTPEQTPALFGALLATLNEEGVHVPKHGMYSLVECLSEMLRLQNVKLRLGYTVEKIENGQVFGTDKCDNHFDAVVSNLDPVVTAKLASLQPPKSVKCPLSCSVVGLFGAIKPELSLKLPMHQVIVPANLDHFFRDLSQGELPESTMVFVHNYQCGQAGNPNQEHAVISVLFTVPAAEVSTNRLESFLEIQSARVARLMGLASFEEIWVGEPLRLERSDYAEFGHPSGALYGHLVAPQSTGPFHPVPYRTTHEWLWQVGAGVHPGGGIPGTVGGAMIVSEKLLRRLAS